MISAECRTLRFVLVCLDRKMTHYPRLERTAAALREAMLRTSGFKTPEFEGLFGTAEAVPSRGIAVTFECDYHLNVHGLPCHSAPAVAAHDEALSRFQ